jgi:hypothetical protein
VPVSQTATLLLGFPLGFFQSGIVAGMGATFAELFPVRARDRPGVLDNFGRGVGSLMPTVVGILGGTMALGQRSASARCSLRRGPRGCRVAAGDARQSAHRPAHEPVAASS